jgi:hypothetical protein
VAPLPCLISCHAVWQTQVSKSQADTGANHAISALKFGIIKKFLQLGWSVLLSDIDVCVLQDPFKVLYRSVRPSINLQHNLQLTLHGCLQGLAGCCMFCLVHAADPASYCHSQQ